MSSEDVPNKIKQLSNIILLFAIVTIYLATNSKLHSHQTIHISTTYKSSSKQTEKLYSLFSILSFSFSLKLNESFLRRLFFSRPAFCNRRDAVVASPTSR